ncbi:OmpA family protein, partial [Bacterioplanoides pacificum]
SDNDGISDTTEKGDAETPRDSDGDLIPDYMDEDSDNDGIADADEKGDAETPRDSDDDGIPDYRDDDSDNDGVADSPETAGEDYDRDGIPDYRDAINDLDKQQVQTGVSGGAVGPVMMLLILVILVQRSFAKFIVLVSIVLLSPVVYADDYSGFYGGVGVGRSELEPKISGTGFRRDQKHDDAWKLLAGYDWNDRWSLEGFYADLGKTHLDPQGEVSYQMMGATMVGNYWLFGKARKSGSLSLYGKGGLANMNNQGKDLRVQKQESVHFMFGAGVEYYLPKAVSLRLEYEVYDRDASYWSLNIVKRFGDKSSKYPVRQETKVNKEAVLEPVEEAEEKLNAIDNTEVVKVHAPEVAVVAIPSIQKVDEIMVNIRFSVNSTEIATDDMMLLEGIARDIKSNPAMRIEIQAHTDSRGSASYNQQLSQKRAEAVSDYLQEHGVAEEQLIAKGYGEAQPIASNDNATGRAKNRRVEFVVISR